MMHRPIVNAGLLVAALVLMAGPTAAEGPSDAELKQANNPLASFNTFNIQNYFVPQLSGLPDDTANTTWLRGVIPVGPWIVRASLPLNNFPVGGGENQSGLGDLNAFAAYTLSKGGAPRIYGVGPLMVAPTATDDALGSGKWQLGAAAVYFDMSSSQVQWGGLVTWQTSVAGDDDREDTNTLVVQPFAFFQLGKGTYLRTAPIWVFDLENSTYNVPIGFGIGKVLATPHTVYNIFLEPQFTALNKGAGQPQFQVFAGINMQFKKKG
jgi:hypothetical protein